MNLMTLLTGANPHLFYLSLFCIVGGIVSWFLVRGLVTSLVQERIQKAMAPSPETDPYSLIPRMGLGSMLREHSEMASRQQAAQAAVRESAGILALANGALSLCWVLVGTGVVGMVIYLVQRYGVV